jgi:hypothetical protein
MIPAAPALGAVLWSDATAYRPLGDGYTWSYRGRDASPGPSAPALYASSVSHKSGSNGTITETSTNVLAPGSGTDDVTVAVSGGTILVTETLDPFGPASAVSVTAPELRSPVRQGDQYTAFERTFTNTGVDVDRDGKQDDADLAAYSRVIGEEDAPLANGSSVRALRVDLVLLTRFKRSSDSQYTPVSQAVQSTWYVRGIGPVRRTLKTPGVTGPDGLDVDERLATFDGITTGYGYLEPTRALKGPDAASGAGLALGQTVGAAAIGTKTLLFTERPLDPSGADVSVVDARGRVISTKTYTGLVNLLPNSAFSSDYVSIVPAGSRVAVLATVPGGVGFDLRMYLFDDSGALVNGSSGTTFVFSTAVVPKVAFDGSRLWFMWSKGQSNPAANQILVMRAFDLTGVPVGAELVLEDAPMGTDFGSYRLAAGGGRALASWVTTSFSGGAAFRHVMTAGNSLASTPRNLVIMPGISLGEVITTLRPVVSGTGGGALLWDGTLLNANQGGAALRGVGLDTSDVAIRTVSGSIDAELLPLGPVPSDLTAGMLYQSGGLRGSLYTVRSSLPGKAFDFDQIGYGYIQVARMPAGAALAASEAKQVRIPISPVADPSDPPLAVVPLQDRLLVFGGDGRTTVTVVWAVSDLL